MENTSNIGNLFAFSHDPVVFVEAGVVTYMNPPALNEFGRDKLYMPETALIPAQLLEVTTDQFVASAMICGKVMTVSRSTFEKQRLYSFILPSPKDDESIFHSVSASMRELTGGIKANADLIRGYSQKYDDPSLKKFSAVLNHYTAKLKRLVNNYSLFSGFKQNTQQFNPGMTSLNQFCKELSEEISAITIPHNIQVSFHAEDNIIASVDRELLMQLLTNLISNSLNHMPNGGYIKLRISTANNYIVFIVEDNGTGISDEVLANVFRAYNAPIDFSSANFTTGLGLSVCDAIAKIHGGTLIIESKQNIGTRAIVQIPKIVDHKLMSPKAEYKIPMRDLIMNDLSTWLSWEDYLREP